MSSNYSNLSLSLYEGLKNLYLDINKWSIAWLIEEILFEIKDMSNIGGSLVLLISIAPIILSREIVFKIGKLLCTILMIKIGHKGNKLFSRETMNL